MLKIGVIADTHGLLRPEAVAALRGCEQIVHAGDVGKPAVLDELRRLAPVSVIRGNVDRGAWAQVLPEVETLTLGGVTMHVLHDRAELDPASIPAAWRVIISGHSHKPSLEEKDGVLWINPGSAGPRRFRLPVTVARLDLEGGVPRARLITLGLTEAGALPGSDQVKK